MLKVIPLLCLFCVVNAWAESVDFEQLKIEAEQGNSVAQYELGQSYYYGEGFEQDYKEAVK
jgi:TPR repeat protein